MRDENETDWDDDAPRDPWIAEMTRQGVEDIRALQEAGQWEAFVGAMDDDPTPETEAAFLRAANLDGPSPARGGYRRASDATWAAARADYLAGAPAEAVCGRHGLAVSTFRARARAEGWRRSDQPDPEPVDLEAEEEAGLLDYAEMARHALVRLNRAVLRGRAAEAAGWMRLHVRLTDLARASEAAAAPPAPDAPKPAPAPAPRPARARDPLDAVMASMRTVQSMVGAASALDPRDPISRRLIEKGLEVLDVVERAAISDDSDHSDGVFPPPESETGPPDRLLPMARHEDGDRAEGGAKGRFPLNQPAGAP